MTVSDESDQEATQEEGRNRGHGGKLEWKLSEIISRAVSKGKNELICEFKIMM